MRLISTRVRKFRNILDSGEVAIDSAVTCLVGKNESGKTAFLHALYRLNPARPNVNFSVPAQYPAWQEKRDRLRGENLEDVQPITAVFALDPTGRQALEDTFGVGTLGDPDRLIVSRNYKGVLSWEFEFVEAAFVSHVIERVDWPRGTKTDANKLRSIEDLKAYAEQLRSEATEGDGRVEAGQSVIKELGDRLTANDLRTAISKALADRLPQFLYFSEYSTLPYSAPIRRLLTSKPAELSDEELTARSLLKLAAAENEYLINPDYERRKRELENVSSALTQDVLKFWTQNPELRVQPDITLTTIPSIDGRGGTQSTVDELKIRIWDQRHQLSLPFNEHSTGFRWFFSFLAAFSEYEYRSDPIIILLDEPALGLHARAQADFLRFINERLTTTRQVLYTTHSPFMVEPGRLDRVRLVEDKGQTEGTKITSDVSTTDPDTLFPLQGALGYDLAQHLFIGAHNLVVEGTSDFTYLRVVSDYFAAEGTRTPLDERWSLVPVGGVDLVPTFAALLGNHLDLTVLIDAQKGGHQRLSRLTDQGILSAKRIITVGAVLGRPEADIEDLFDDSEYLDLFNRAFSASIAEAQFKGTDPIVRRIARVLGKDRFDHGRPADVFLRKRDEILPLLSAATLDRFERLFVTLNGTLT